MSRTELRKQRREAGLCIECGDPANGKSLCAPHLERQKEAAARYQDKQRKCPLCKVTRVDEQRICIPCRRKLVKKHSVGVYE